MVLDTNCFISCIGKKSIHRSVFESFLEGRYTLCVSNEILLEYEEKFSQFWGDEVTRNLLGTLLTAGNTQLHDIYFNFHLVDGDRDDNKFPDTYLSASADFLVTNDSKLLALADIAFPNLVLMTLEQFADYLATLG